MNRKVLFLISLLLSFVFVFGCGKSIQNSSISSESENPSQSDSSEEGADEVIIPASDSEVFTSRDSETAYNENDSVKITLTSASATASSPSVKIDGSKVTISEEGTYIISGSLENGTLIVDADKNAKPHLIFDNVSISSESSAALYVKKADKVFITLPEGTDNKLSSGSSFTPDDESNIDSAIFSKEDITFNGKGALSVESPAGHAIVSKDDLVIIGGTYSLYSSSHGIEANDSVRIKEASLNIDAGKDGIHCEDSDDTSTGFVYISGGNFKIEAEGDGISSHLYTQISSGDFDIITGGGSSNASLSTSSSWGKYKGNPHSSYSSTEDDGESIKGIKSNGIINIDSGAFTIDSADDAIHSDSSISINGGSFDISTGDDGFHADDRLTVNDGKIKIHTSYEGLEALELIITGGDIDLVATDDGLNAAGGVDSSGKEGFRGEDTFGQKGPHGMGGPQNMNSSSNGKIVISGGNIYIKASGDGIDANGSVEISGGKIIVCCPTRGDTSTLDYDKSATISGGIFIGTGAAGMAQSFSDSEQGVIALNVGNQKADTEIKVADSAGNSIITHSPELDYAIVILSSPEMQKGESYTVSIGNISDTFEAY